MDDILITSQDVDWIERTKQILTEDFELKDFEKVEYCLGIEFAQSGDTIAMSQTGYTRDLLRQFQMDECNPVSTPMEMGTKLIRSNRKCELQGSRPYRELIGGLMYLAMATRPDITNAVAKLSQFSNFPEEVHWHALKRVLRYLQGTDRIGFMYHKTGQPVIGYSDVDWDGCEMDRKSFSGYNFILGCATISWKSQKQPIVVLSSTEAEYMALTEAAKEASYLRGVLIEVGLRRAADTVVYVDYPMFHRRTKHIDIKYHFVRDTVNAGEVTLTHTSSE